MDVPVDVCWGDSRISVRLIFIFPLEPLGRASYEDYNLEISYLFLNWSSVVRRDRTLEVTHCALYDLSSTRTTSFIDLILFGYRKGKG